MSLTKSTRSRAASRNLPPVGRGPSSGGWRGLTPRWPRSLRLGVRVYIQRTPLASPRQGRSSSSPRTFRKKPFKRIAPGFLGAAYGGGGYGVMGGRQAGGSERPVGGPRRAL